MKKRLGFFLVLIIIFTICLNVRATDYEVRTLIPVDTTATVKTEKFSYNDFVYNSQLDSRGNALITFGSIQNLSITKVPVSINILLFDESKKNIGFLTYCSDKDISSNYAEFKLSGNQSAPFSINVTDKYFVEGMLPSNVKFIAVLDDNKYCQIGGYDKYKNLTIDEINNGFVNNNKKKFNLNSYIIKLVEKFGIAENGPAILSMIISVIIVFAVYMIVGHVLNMLNRKMYAKKTALAYFPITNTYIAVKLSFGKIIATIYLIIYIISALLYVVFGPILVAIITGIGFLGFIIVIIKLITRKYDLFYYEPSIKMSNYNDLNAVNNGDSSNINHDNYITNNGNEALDLSYSDNFDSSMNDSSNNVSVSSGVGEFSNISTNGESESSTGINMNSIVDMANDVQDSGVTDNFNFTSNNLMQANNYQSNQESNVLNTNNSFNNNFESPTNSVNGSDKKEEEDSDLSKFFS